MSCFFPSVPAMLRIQAEALTYDDVSLVPAHSRVLPRDVALATRLTRDLRLNLPIVSAAMDTVTEFRLAIAMAQLGGIGIVHKNMSVERQAAEVARVKNFEAGVIKEPFTVGPETTIGEVLKLTRARNISGVPVVDDDGHLVGIVTGRDMRFEKKLDDPVRHIMTKRDKLVTVKEGAGDDEVIDLLHKHRIEKVLVVNDEFALRGLITVKDIQKVMEFPNACKDGLGRLRVGAAVGTGDKGLARAERLLEASVDVLVIDTAHGYSVPVIETLKAIKRQFGDAVQVLAGNVATADGAKALVEAGADGVKVGMGPGSICTTRVISGAGMAQVTAIANCAAAIVDTDVPIIGDGGIKYSGDCTKALAAGAHAAMLGGLFAGTEESPGETVLFEGRTYKEYRGMGSLAAMKAGSDRYPKAATDWCRKLSKDGCRTKGHWPRWCSTWSGASGPGWATAGEIHRRTPHRDQLRTGDRGRATGKPSARRGDHPRGAELPVAVSRDEGKGRPNMAKVK